MSADNSPSRSPLGLIFSFIIIAILPLAAGLYLAPRVVPAPKVGVIRLYYDINPETAFEFKEQLDFARRDESIKAVVVVINSPGGTVTDSEEIYLDILDAREQMPVVGSVDFLAASGGYFIAAAMDEIYAKSGAFIGNIGVRSTLFIEPFLDPSTITTGPYKDAGLTPDGQVRHVEVLKFAFLDAVQTGRGDRLQAEPEQLSRGEVFGGLESWDLGLIDGIAATEDVFARAAELAGLRDYEAVELFPLVFLADEEDANGRYRAPTIDQNLLWAYPADLPPGLYYRYFSGPNPQ